MVYLMVKGASATRVVMETDPALLEPFRTAPESWRAVV